MDHFEQAGPSYEMVDFSPLDWYQLEALQDSSNKTGDLLLQEKLAPEITQLLERQSTGDAVFQCLYNGLENKDELKVAWSMARISNLIHETAKTHLGTFKKRTPREIEADYGTRSVARSWIEKDKNRSPIGFGSGTLAQRIFYETKNNATVFSMPTEDEKKYWNNVKYYVAFLKLFNLSPIDLSSSGSDYYIFSQTFNYPHNSLTVNLDKDGIFHGFMVKPNLALE